MRTDLAGLVELWRHNGKETAIVSHVGNRSERTSYAALAQLADRCAAELVRRGIAPGDRIVVWGRNSAEWVAVFFACVVRGVLVVPLDAAGTLEFAQRVVDDTSPRLIVGDPEHLQLDSLGRVQLQSSIEERFGIAVDDASLLAAETLGQLRALVMRPATEVGPSTQAAETPARLRDFVYPRWPWSPLVSMLRIAFVEAVMRPLVWLLLNPRVRKDAQVPATASIVIANHVTVLDLPLLLYGLPGPMRRRVAVAMSGEMLDDWRRGRNQASWWQNLLAPAQYILVTALFNVFPLPRLRGFRTSFAHIGEALDRSFHVVIFPEGRRSETGKLQPFRPGIGLLVQESGAPIVPVALRDMDRLVMHRARWFHNGLVEIEVGEQETTLPGQSADEIARQLHQRMHRMLGDQS
jgi:long-chain acyl-CoA synthetase